MSEIQIQGEQVTFEVPKKVGEGARVKLSVEGGEKVTVSVEHCRPLEDGNYIVVGRANKMLDSHYSTWVPGERRNARKPERLRVMSPDIPNYHGLTVNLSHGGVQIETEAPVAVGEQLRLEIGFQDAIPDERGGAGLSDLPCQAEVLWCEPSGDRNYRIGCRFVEVTKQFALGLNGVLGRSREPIVNLTHEEEQTPLNAVLTKFEMADAGARIWLKLDEEHTREVRLPNVVSMSDHRHHSGMIVGYLSCREMPRGARIRFLNPHREKIFELETERCAP